jgi:hypothetical protein
MNDSPNDRRSPLAASLGELAPMLYGRLAGNPRALPWHFLVIPTEKGSMRVCGSESYEFLQELR